MPLWSLYDPTVMALKAMAGGVDAGRTAVSGREHQMYVVVEGDVVEPGGGEGDGIWIMGSQFAADVDDVDPLGEEPFDVGDVIVRPRGVIGGVGGHGHDDFSDPLRMHAILVVIDVFGLDRDGGGQAGRVSDVAVQYADLDAAALVVLGVPHIVGAGSADGVGQLQLRAGLVVIQVGDLVIPGQVVHLIQSDVDQDERGVLADVEDILLVEMVRRKGLVLLGVQCPGRETLGLYVVLHCVGVFFIGGRGGDRHGGRGFQAAEGRRQRGGGEQAGARRAAARRLP